MTQKTMTVLKNDEQKPQSEELFTKDEMENTPFWIITNKDLKISFGTFGNYKITEDYHTPEQVKAELSKITWNRLVQIMSLVNTMLNNKKQ